LDDSTLRSRVASEGLRFVRANLDSALLCRRTEAVYQKALPKRRTVPILIGGYFGCGNLGDDAILQAILHELSTSHPTVRPTVLSGSPMRDRKRLGIGTLCRKDPFSILWGLFRARLFVLGGGSLLQNRTGNLSLFYYLWLLKLARLMRLPSVLFASGIGPLLGEGATRWVQKVLRSVDLIGLRDTHSKQLLRALGVPPQKLSLGADACFLLPLPPQSRALFLRQSQKSPQTRPFWGSFCGAEQHRATLRSCFPPFATSAEKTR
jgi:polysaccharide pyruvyl transferase CsaB